MSQPGGEPEPGATPATGVKVSPCDAACVDILTRVIYAEAAGESDAVMAAMGWVVINRVRDDTHEFKDLGTCAAVVNQPGAFSSVGGKLWVAGEEVSPADLLGQRLEVRVAHDDWDGSPCLRVIGYRRLDPDRTPF